MAVGLVRQQDVLDAQQGDEDEGGPHRPHVQAGFSLMRDAQFGDDDPNDVEKEEEIHLSIRKFRYDIRNTSI